VRLVGALPVVYLLAGVGITAVYDYLLATKPFTNRLASFRILFALLLVALLSPAFLIGLAQVLALIPGTSRSGITMTAARMLGFERDASARFSLLLSIPVIVAAAALAGLDLFKAGDLQLTFDALVAIVLAFVSAYVAIWAMMAWLKRSSFTPFVVYRLALGIGLLVWLYT
jgi:undecaprenyl pyrophosphate phosphatase UppP